MSRTTPLPDDLEIIEQTREFKRSLVPGYDNARIRNNQQQFLETLPVPGENLSHYDSWLSRIIATECIVLVALISVKLMFALFHLAPVWLLNPYENEPELGTLENIMRYRDPDSMEG